jgi:GntR family transcriptional regulator, histidine utilization repressor
MSSLPDSAAPLYEKVNGFVLKNIDSGVWAPHARLPSEHELVVSLGVSRMTVHRAPRELTSAGSLKRIQGVGTFVAQPRPHSALLEISNIATEIRRRGGQHRAEVVVLERIEKPRSELMLAFEFESVRPLDHSVVIHFENDVSVQMEERFVNPSLVSGYIDQDFTTITTFEYLQAATPLTEVEHVISAVLVGHDKADLLKVSPADPCLMLFRKTWTGAKIATVNTFTYTGKYSLGSRYSPARR